MKELKLMLESVTRQTTKEEMDARFPIIARYIMDNYGIKSGDRLYLLNEIEFYYYNPLYDDLRAGSSKSLITYKRNAAAGCWFFHDYGVDLTFNSSSAEGYGGGILIRSVEDSITHAATVGPVKCVNEIWDDAVDAFSPTAPNPFVVRVGERGITLNEPDTRVTVDKVDRYKSRWNFTVCGKKTSR